MDDDLAGTSRDLLLLRNLHPSEIAFDASAREDAIRRLGRWSLIVGASGAIISYVAALGVGVLLTDTPAAEQNTAGRLFLVLSLVAVIGVAAVLIALGGAERLGRHHRAAVRLALLALEDNRSQLAELRFQVAPLHAELEAIKEAIANLPKYGEGVIDGVSLRSEVLREP